MISTKFGRNKVFYGWGVGNWSLEHIIENINKRICNKTDDDIFLNNMDLVYGRMKNLEISLNIKNKKLKDILKQELKIDVDDYEYVTETKLVKKHKTNK